VDGASVDTVLADPPYSSGTRREGQKGLRKAMNRTTDDGEWFGSDSLTTPAFAYLMRQCAIEWRRVLRNGGHILAFIDWRMAGTLSGALDIAAAVESADLRYAGIVVWDKTHFGMGSCFRNQHEFILHFTKGVGVPQRRNQGNVIACAPVRGSEDNPTEKPVRLLSDLLTTVTPVNGLVLDCFAGSGACAEAAIINGFRYLGIDNRESQVAATRRRIDSARQTLFSESA